MRLRNSTLQLRNCSLSPLQNNSHTFFRFFHHRRGYRRPRSKKKKKKKTLKKIAVFFFNTQHFAQLFDQSTRLLAHVSDINSTESKEPAEKVVQHTGLQHAFPRRSSYRALSIAAHFMWSFAFLMVKSDAYQSKFGFARTLGRPQMEL